MVLRGCAIGDGNAIRRIVRLGLADVDLFRVLLHRRAGGHSRRVADCSAFSRFFHLALDFGSEQAHRPDDRNASARRRAFNPTH